MKVGKVTPAERAKLIIDHRAEEPVVPPSAPDSLVRGLPQTPYEFELYKQKRARDAAYKAGIKPQPQAEPMFPSLDPPPEPGPGDPAGLEARRTQIMAEIAERSRVLKEIEGRLRAVKKTGK